MLSKAGCGWGEGLPQPPRSASAAPSPREHRSLRQTGALLCSAFPRKGWHIYLPCFLAPEHKEVSPAQ